MGLTEKQKNCPYCHVDFHILTLIFQDTGMLKPKSVLKILSLKHVQLFIVAHNAVAR